MKKNPFYTAPEAEFLDVWFEENILSGPGSANDGYGDNPLDDLGD